MSEVILRHRMHANANEQCLDKPACIASSEGGEKKATHMMKVRAC
jgi:hypothetical protein